MVEGHYATGRKEVGGVSIFRYLTSEIRSNQSSPDLMSTHYSYLLSRFFRVVRCCHLRAVQMHQPECRIRCNFQRVFLRCVGIIFPHENLHEFWRSLAGYEFSAALELETNGWSWCRLCNRSLPDSFTAFSHKSGSRMPGVVRRSER